MNEAIQIQCGSAIPHGNVIPLLHEIRHALQKMLDTGESTVIDLRSLPMAPGEEDHIEETLGKGELSITLDAIGPTTIQETAIGGVWLITHRNTAEEILTKSIEIAAVPEIVLAQQDDMEDGIETLKELLLEQGSEV